MRLRAQNGVDKNIIHQVQRDVTLHSTSKYSPTGGYLNGRSTCLPGIEGGPPRSRGVRLTNYRGDLSDRRGRTLAMLIPLRRVMLDNEISHRWLHSLI